VIKGDVPEAIPRRSAPKQRLIAGLWKAMSARSAFTPSNQEVEMAKGEQRGNREAKKPKKEKIKVIAAAPSQKGAGWQPSLSSGKNK